MKTFKDMYLREEKMCGFRSDRDMFWASFAVILLPVIMWAIKIWNN